MTQADTKTSRITLHITVDPQAWEEIYGEKPSRSDVEQYAVMQLASSAAAEDGAIVNVEP